MRQPGHSDVQAWPCVLRHAREEVNGGTVLFQRGRGGFEDTDEFKAAFTIGQRLSAVPDAVEKMLAFRARHESKSRTTAWISCRHCYNSLAKRMMAIQAQHWPKEDFVICRGE